MRCKCCGQALYQTYTGSFVNRVWNPQRTIGPISRGSRARRQADTAQGWVNAKRHDGLFWLDRRYFNFGRLSRGVLYCITIVMIKSDLKVTEYPNIVCITKCKDSDRDNTSLLTSSWYSAGDVLTFHMNVVRVLCVIVMSEYRSRGQHMCDTGMSVFEKHENLRTHGRVMRNSLIRGNNRFR